MPDGPEVLQRPPPPKRTQTQMFDGRYLIVDIPLKRCIYKMTHVVLELRPSQIVVPWSAEIRVTQACEAALSCQSPGASQ